MAVIEAFQQTPSMQDPEDMRERLGIGPSAREQEGAAVPAAYFTSCIALVE